MNKRIKKKHKLETAVVLLIAENAMQAEAIKNQNRQIAELRSII
ncbi:phage protein [Streptococcus pyogenes]|nr:phage protein [Streptococcus pyogenes]VGU81129.1 phage protein [Streptococcus pyogenes]VGW89654.1 phage protein [Streptococcus pyogenes]VGW95685.1 phage protein [Streptococcus pyogenes]VGW97679.1 phage protein [Streptococcus pyogenes]